MRPAITAVLVFLAAAIGLVFFHAPQRATQPATQSATGPATRGAAAALPPEQLDYARRPISYFNDRCGNCHGNYGSFWGEGFAAELDDAQLRQIVEEMADGPAFAPLEEMPLDVQTAYHRSLVDGRPFVTAYLGEDGALMGEVTPGGRVAILLKDGGERAAAVQKHAWKGDVRDVQQASAVRVSQDGRTTELPLGELAGNTVRYSHQRPAPSARRPR